VCPECNSLFPYGTRLCSNGITLGVYVFHVMTVLSCIVYGSTLTRFLFIKAYNVTMERRK
jgi:hypothetical protein